MTAEPVIADRPAQPYVAIRTLVSMETIGTEVPPLNQAVFGWLADHGIPPAGPPFWKYNVIDMAHGLEVEAGVTVATAVPADGRVLAGVLPAGRYVTVHHVGHPATLASATSAMLQWAAAQDLAWDMAPSPEGERWGCRLEIYYTDPRVEPDMTKWETGLAFRLANVSAP